MRDGIITSKTKRTLQKAKDPSNTIRPSSGVDEFAEDKVPVLKVGRSARKTDNDDNNSTSQGPENGSLIDHGQQP